MNISIYKVTFLLYQLLIFLKNFAVYLFGPKDCKEKSFYQARDYFLILSGRWIGNEQLFKVGLTKHEFKASHARFKHSLTVFKHNEENVIYRFVLKQIKKTTKST